MKNVLLLGDSIRQNYMPYVFRNLSDVAVVYGPDDNCRFAKYTLWYLDQWLGNIKYDVIHFNCGIWDFTRLEQCGGEVFTDIGEYKRDLKKIIHALKKTGAKLIIATTTPVKHDSLLHHVADADIYNEALLSVAKEEGLEIDDLFSVVNADREKYICEDNIHLSKEGIKAAGDVVAEKIREFL